MWTIREKCSLPRLKSEFYQREKIQTDRVLGNVFLIADRGFIWLRLWLSALYSPILGPALLKVIYI